MLRAASLSHPRAAEIWSDKCGSCHVPVEPGTRPRGTIEAAMVRHQKRAKLTEGEWRELVDFLSENASRTAENHTPAPARHTPWRAHQKRHCRGAQRRQRDERRSRRRLQRRRCRRSRRCNRSPR